MSCNYMSKNDELRKGDYLKSNNGKWSAIFQDDGNFVIYDKCENITWASGTYGPHAFRLCLQSNCNLIIYDQRNTSLWSSRSGMLECNMCRLQLTDDGVLELYREAEMIWNTTDLMGKK